MKLLNVTYGKIRSNHIRLWICRTDWKTHDNSTDGQHSREAVSRGLWRRYSDADLEVRHQGDEHEPHLHQPCPRRPLLWIGAISIELEPDAQPHGRVAPVASCRLGRTAEIRLRALLLHTVQARYAPCGYDKSGGTLRGQRVEGGDNSAEPLRAMLRFSLQREA